MGCENCYWNQWYNGFKRCMSKGVYLWTSADKDEEGRFCESFRWRIKECGLKDKEETK